MTHETFLTSPGTMCHEHDIMIHIKHRGTLEYELWNRRWAGFSHGEVRTPSE